MVLNCVCGRFSSLRKELIDILGLSMVWGTARLGAFALRCGKVFDALMVVYLYVFSSFIKLFCTVFRNRTAVRSFYAHSPLARYLFFLRFSYLLHDSVVLDETIYDDKL